MQSNARTVAEYLKQLPADRREAIEAVRRVILATVDGDIEEGMQYGHIGYSVPHRVFPNGYHCDPSVPLPYLGLASQKQHMAAYLMFAYIGGSADEAWIRAAYAKAGRRIDMGKCCLRFRTLQDIDLDILAEAIHRAPTRAYVRRYCEMVGPGAWKSKGAKRIVRTPGATTAARTAAKTAAKTVKTIVKKTVKNSVKKSVRKSVQKAAKKK